MTPGWPLVVTWILLLAFGVTAIGWNGVYLAEVAHIAGPQHAGRATGASLFFIFGGVLLGPSGFVVAYRAIGSYTGSYILAGLAALLGLAFVALARHHRHHDQEPDRLRPAAGPTG
jgi:hypothetical protein